MAKKLKSRATEKSGVYMVSVLRNWLLIFFLATSRGWSPSRRPPAKSNGYLFFSDCTLFFIFSPLGGRKGMEVAPSFFLFFLIYLSFCSSWPPLWARQRSCRVSHHHAQCHIIIHSVTSYTVGKAEMDWKSHPCFFFNFFFLLAKRQRCNGTLLDLNRLRETGLVASFFFLNLFWWNGSPPNFLFLQLATTVGKSALDVASAAMTAQDKITAAAMAAPAKIYR